jgi:metal transporter CNNM
MNYVIVFVLVILSGMFSGLTIGMFSLGLSTLQRRIRLGDKQAEKVYSVRKNGNFLLCTLLLGNVAVNSSMAVFLGTIAPGVIAGLIATGLIVLFGEIFPQAVFTRFALKLGAKTIWITRFFMFILYPFSRPIAWILDRMLGRELPAIWDKREIKEIIKYHEDSPLSSIDKDEERITLGALSFSDQVVKNIFTPKAVVYWLPGHRIIDGSLITELKAKGFTRIPVFNHEKKDQAGILLAKDLLGADFHEKKTVWELSRKNNVIKIREEETLDRVLNLFITKKIHLAFVYDRSDAFVGIVTLEDILEEIIRAEIMDELDITDDMRKLVKPV